MFKKTTHIKNAMCWINDHHDIPLFYTEAQQPIYAGNLLPPALLREYAQGLGDWEIVVNFRPNEDAT